MSDLSKSLTAAIPVATQKRDGIFFTPPAHVRHVLDVALKGMRRSVRDVLEPSCGSCEFVRELDTRLSKARVDGYEINRTIYDKIKQLRFKNKVRLHHGDFLKSAPNKRYDLIVGNPPYYETTNPSPSARLPSGRVNVYLLFIDRALSLLRPGGVLAFVLPSNFLTNSYGDRFRRHIAAYYSAVDVHVFDDATKYLNTAQRTCALVVRKEADVKSTPSWRPFAHVVGGNMLFNTRYAIKHIRALTKNTSTLAEKGFRVSVGSVLWNASRDELTDDSTKTRLIYGSDIAADRTITKTSYRDPKKKHFVDRPGVTTPCVVVNRGHGNSTKGYDFRFALLNTRPPYLLENHVLAVRYMPTKHRTLGAAAQRSGAVCALRALARSFEDPRTRAFARIALTNNAINAYELEHMMPVYPISN